MSNRKEEFAHIGAKLAAKHGIINVTRGMIAEVAGCSEVLVGNVLGNKDERSAAMRKAMRKLGLKEPDKKTIADEGVRLRKHGPRKPEVLKAMLAKAARTRGLPAPQPPKRKPREPREKKPVVVKRVPRKPPTNKEAAHPAAAVE